MTLAFYMGGIYKFSQSEYIYILCWSVVLAINFAFVLIIADGPRLLSYCIYCYEKNIFFISQRLSVHKFYRSSVAQFQNVNDCNEDFEGKFLRPQSVQWKHDLFILGHLAFNKRKISSKNNYLLPKHLGLVVKAYEASKEIT